MKKTLLVLLSLALAAFLLAGCNAGTETGKEEVKKSAYQLYTEASQTLADAESMDMDITGTMNVVMEETTLAMTMDGNIKIVKKGETDMDMSTDIAMSVMGQNVTTIAYYTNGYYYIDVSGQKMKLAMPMEEALAESNSKNLDFPETSIIESSSTTTADGTLLSFTIDGNVMTDLVDDQLKSLEGIVGTDDWASLNAKFNSLVYEVTLDANGVLKSYRIIIDMEMTIEDVLTTMSYDLTSTINSINNVTITLPTDLDTYKEVTL